MCGYRKKRLSEKLRRTKRLLRARKLKTNSQRGTAKSDQSDILGENLF